MRKKTRLLIRDAFFSTLISCLLFAILSITFFNIRFFNPLHKAFNDFHFLDVFYAEKFHEKKEVINDIVLVNIKEYNRLEIALLLEKVLEEDPSVVGIDIIFKERKENQYADSLLVKLLNHKKVITAYEQKKDGVVKSHPYFETKDKQSGFVEFNFDNSTSVIREFLGVYEFEGDSKLSFASKIAKMHSEKKWKKRNIKDKLKTPQRINYTGNYNSFQYLDFDDFIDYEKKPILKDKIVLLGYLGQPTGNIYDINDKYFTPLNTIIAGKSDADMFGITVHANIINMLVKNDFIYKISNLWTGIITFLFMYLSTIYYMKLSKKYKISYRTRKQLFQLLFAIILFTLTIILFKNDVILQFTPIIVGVVLAGGYWKYYKHLTRYINTKRKWKTYLK